MVIRSFKSWISFGEIPFYDIQNAPLLLNILEVMNKLKKEYTEERLI